ncbi:cadherin-like domain-containing protein [Glaciecola sp. MH2013]|uniref:reprolysin-like metallopeptidase n=1 Tax=Glaciecola sp. MH2013 TaxID=2785524 RepID=UPI00189EDAF8|nr:zinc-dependent metalloprotease family protein [Glaciecola sp. MH2013]MBF7073556.1 cadherin-like domain-containing protein [Glaciecola sp. MH2013]
MKRRFTKSLISSIVLMSLSMAAAHSATRNPASTASINKQIWQQSEENHWSLQNNELLTKARETQRIALPIYIANTAEYTMSKSRVMSPALSAKYPNIQSYNIQHGDDLGYLVISSDSMSGAYQINGQWHDIATDYSAQASGYNGVSSQPNVRISPSFDNQLEAKKALQSLEALHQELLNASIRQAKGVNSSDNSLADTGDTLTTYRLAVSASGEYTSSTGGTVESALAGIVTLFTRVNQVVEKDLAISFELIGNNDQLIFLDADTDPFTNDDGSADIDENQVQIDAIIGSENYDIGHLLNTNGGGLAGLGALCVNSFKAKGYTGSRQPSGERFIVDLLLHEVGHQLGGEHSFNASESNCNGNRSRSGRASVEIGSGTTIMSYAGICSSQNISRISTPHFHAFSIDQMRQTIDRRNCGVNTSLANTAPSISLSANNYLIPALTPFLLDATVTDEEQSELEHIWEQVDPGGINGATANITEASTDNGENPLFRSFEPVAETYRYFPSLASVISGELALGEVYPNTNRELSFRLVSRDQAAGVATANVTVEVVKTSSAFSLSSQAFDETWESSTTQELRWNTGDSELAPINCAAVDVLVDADQDNLFELAIASDIPNTGSASISAPNINLDSSRLMLKCSTSVFFSLSSGEINFVSVDDMMPMITGQTSAVSAPEDTNYTVTLADLVVSDGDSSYPDDFTLEVLDGDNYSVNANQVTFLPDFNGDLSVQVQVNDGMLDSNVFDFVISVSPVNDAPIINGQNQLSVDEDQTVILSVNNLSVSDIDNSLSELSLVLSSGENYSFSGSTVIPDSDFFGSLTIDLRVSDGTDVSDSFALELNVENVNDAPVAESDSVVLLQGSGSTNISVLQNDIDADSAAGDTLTVVAISYSGQGAASFDASSVNYQASASFIGSETITYTIEDAAGEQASATINIRVNEIPASTPEESPASDSSGGSIPMTLIALLSVFAWLRRSSNAK